MRGPTGPDARQARILTSPRGADAPHDTLSGHRLERLSGKEIVGHLLKLRNSIQQRGAEADRAEDMTDVQNAAMKAVNDYFERALRSVPEIDAYLKEIVERAP